MPRFTEIRDLHDSLEYWRGVCERQQVAGKELTEQVERLSAERDAALAKVSEWEKDKDYILKANAANEWEDRFQIQQNRIQELFADRAALLEVMQVYADRRNFVQGNDWVWTGDDDPTDAARAVIEQVERK